MDFVWTQVQILPLHPNLFQFENRTDFDRKREGIKYNNYCVSSNTIIRDLEITNTRICDFKITKKFKFSELHRMFSSLILQIFGALWITYTIANSENGQRRCFRFVEILNMNFVCIQVQTFCIFSNTNALLYELKYKSYLYTLTLTFSNLKIEQILTKKRKV